MKTNGLAARRRPPRIQRMQVAQPTSANTSAGKPARNESGSSLLEVIDRALDKGVMVDAWARVPVAGLDLITIDASAFVASIDTYLRYAQSLIETPVAAMPPSPPPEIVSASDGAQVAPAQHDAAHLAQDGAAPLPQRAPAPPALDGATPSANAGVVPFPQESLSQPELAGMR
jgi:gas vesicle structural protein